MLPARQLLLMNKHFIPKDTPWIHPSGRAGAEPPSPRGTHLPAAHYRSDSSLGFVSRAFILIMLSFLMRTEPPRLGTAWWGTSGKLPLRASGPRNCPSTSKGQEKVQRNSFSLKMFVLCALNCICLHLLHLPDPPALQKSSSGATLRISRPT